MKQTSWIHDLLEETCREVETPYNYLYWSLMTCISAAAANNFSLRALKGNVVYYPNLYVMLLGDSGLGKGFPVSLAKKIVQSSEITRTIAGRSSIQAIIKELSTTRSEKGKPLITDSRGFIVNGELSTAIIADPDSLTILTDLFDRNDNPTWTNMLKGDGQEKLKEPYVTCLFGSSPAHFYDSIPQANIEGGYIGRNLIIYEEKRSQELDLLDEGAEVLNEDKFTEIIVPNFIPHLKKITSCEKTKFEPDDAARLIFNKWRKEWRANQAVYNDRTGFVNRVPDHVLKVSMCLSLSRYEFNGCIRGCDVSEAIEKVTSLIYASKKAADGSGLDPFAQITKKILDFLIAAEQNQMTRQQLLVKGFGNYNELVLDKVIETLLEMRWIKKERIGVGVNMDWLIHLAGEPLSSYNKFKENQQHERTTT